MTTPAEDNRRTVVSYTTDQLREILRDYEIAQTGSPRVPEIGHIVAVGEQGVSTALVMLTVEYIVDE
jgi:hypothetical protein